MVVGVFRNDKNKIKSGEIRGQFLQTMPSHPANLPSLITQKK
jgi:hypothetical protein